MSKIRPFARLMTAEDFEVFFADLMCMFNSISCVTARDLHTMLSLDEALLRQRIQDLQHWRKIGLKTDADVDKYNADLEKRVRTLLQLTLGIVDSRVTQKVAKTGMARDYYAAERLQLRTGGGRHSSGPDSRRDSEVRELTPKLPGAAAANGSMGPSGRKIRKSQSGGDILARS